MPLERLYHWEKTQPNKICFTQPIMGGKVETFSWKRVARHTRCMATYLLEIGLQPGDKVAIYSRNCAHWIMADLAIWMAGGVSVPLYPDMTSSHVKQILSHSDAKFLFVGRVDGWDNILSDIPGHIVGISLPFSAAQRFPFWDDIVSTTQPLSDSPSRTHHELATIIYTSGTTGIPKGVMHSFYSLAVGAYHSSSIFQASSEDRILSYLSLSYVAERVIVELMNLYQGVHVFFADSVRSFYRELHRSQPTILFGVPRIWEKFRDDVFETFPERKLVWWLALPLVRHIVQRRLRNRLGLSCTRMCFSAGAPLSGAVLKWYHSIGMELLELYGLTENMGYSHSTRSGQAWSNHVGLPNPMVNVKLSSEGEVLVCSPSNMMGYFKEPELTRDMLDEQGFLHTGDLGRIESNGNLKIVGRLKDIFKTSKGKYVAPHPIETKFLSNPLIEHCCVIGQALPQPVALVVLSKQFKDIQYDSVLKDKTENNLIRLLQAVNGQLNPHEKIKIMVVIKGAWNIESGFLTPTLKIKRQAIEILYRERVEEWFDEPVSVLWE